MKTKRSILSLAVGLICILGIAIFMKRGNGIPDQDATITTNDRDTNTQDAVSFDQAKDRAIEIVKQRDVWPQTPVAVCKAFWIARANKDYTEMEVLWPGSASFNWPELCKSDPDVEYLFGEASADGTRVPYAAKSHFDKNNTYNLTMHLTMLDTNKGPRYYIMSGN
jgi:hypothetical protein